MNLVEDRLKALVSGPFEGLKTRERTFQAVRPRMLLARSLKLA